MPAPVVHIVGARPNFMKAAPVIAAVSESGLPQRLVHTGQHYDELLSDVFFGDLGLPEPDENLNIGSGTHGEQTGALLAALEQVFARDPISLVVVYGDVNSTMAAALAASKLGLPIAHVEAGLRSFDRTMPEEINRVVTDQLSDVHFVTSPEAIGHLAREGIAGDGIHFVGNPMIDPLLAKRERFDPPAIRRRMGLEDRYALVTLHRPANVDVPERARSIIEAVHDVAQELEVVIPLHPRGREHLAELGLRSSSSIRVIGPLGYTEFVSLMMEASMVLTDSGGVQEETTMLGVPCLTVRPNTERPITISHGTNRLVEPVDIPNAARSVLGGTDPRRGGGGVPPLWDGEAGHRIAAIIRRYVTSGAGT